MRQSEWEVYGWVTWLLLNGKYGAVIPNHDHSEREKAPS